MNEENKTNVDYIFSHSFNHTLHAYIDIAGDLVSGTLLSQIMYWFAPDENGKTKVRIYRDGNFWIAKKREDWMHEIRISKKQYDTAIKKLVANSLVETKVFKFDSLPTTHIRPVYENIYAEIKRWKQGIAEKLEQACLEVPQKDKMNLPIEKYGNYQNGNNGFPNMGISITEITNKDYLTKITNKEQKSAPDYSENATYQYPNFNFSDDKKRKMLSDMIERAKKISKDKFRFDDTYSDNVISCIKYFVEEYEKKIGKIHPCLKNATLEVIIQRLTECTSDDYHDFEPLVSSNENDEEYRNAIDKYFNTNFGQKTNYNLSHFASEGILKNLMYHIGIY